MLIVTNFPDFPATWLAGDGTAGRSERADDLESYSRFMGQRDAVFLVNCDPRLVMKLSAKQSIRPNARPLISVDPQLRKPRTARAKLKTLGKSVALRGVDLFLHYFADSRRFNETFHIPDGRTSFVPFKSNLWEGRAVGPNPDGDYAVCFGRSLRDYDTFFEAVELSGVPGAIVDPSTAAVWDHGSRFTRPVDQLPANVEVLPHDLTDESQSQILSEARLVVVPIVKETLVASGISTILNAMALGKCVVSTDGPGVSDIFDGETLYVPPEDPVALGELMKRAWEDDELRLRTATKGWEYATRCGSEEDFYQRIIDEVVSHRETFLG